MEQERPQEEEDFQLAQAIHNSEEEYPSLPATDDDKMDTTLEDLAEGEQVEAESVAGGIEKVEEDEGLLCGDMSDGGIRQGDEGFDWLAKAEWGRQTNQTSAKAE